MSQSYVSGGDWLGAITNIPFQALAYNQSIENQKYQRQQDILNRQMQYDFAQNSIKWRVNDAKEAGVHPLAALGVSPSSASPVYSSSEAPRTPHFDFGELFKAQVDLAEAQAEKASAEAQAIKGQVDSGYDGMPINPADTGSAGAPSAKKNIKLGGSNIRSNYIVNEKDYVDTAKEAAQDSFWIKFNDVKAKMENGGVPSNEELDILATATGIAGATSKKGDTWSSRGIQNLKDSAKNLIRDITSGSKAWNMVVDKTNHYDPKVRARAKQALQYLKDIDKEYKSYYNWR